VSCQIFRNTSVENFLKIAGLAAALPRSNYSLTFAARSVYYNFAFSRAAFKRGPNGMR